ncbi:SH3 domain-containing protein [Streptomyces sp. NPDC059479]|uniref:SH3 domain-containing protein n=1 Tax=Streptomyces sp. NPDC059479 TaxID=3346848 RepID=UPI0036C352DE
MARQGETGRLGWPVLVAVRVERLSMKIIGERIRRRLGMVVAAAVAVLLGVVGVTAAAAAPAPQTSVTRVSAGSTKTVDASGLRLRSKPGYSGWVKGLLYRGDRVFIRETYARGAWVGVVLKTRSAGGLPKLTRGYVHKSYLR